METIFGLLVIGVPALLIGGILLGRYRPVFWMFFGALVIGLGYLTTTGTVNDVGKQAIGYIGTPEPEVTPAAAPEPAPAPEPTPSAAPAPAPEPTPAPEAAPAPAPEAPAPTPEPTPAPEAAPAPEATPAPETPPASEPAPAP